MFFVFVIAGLLVGWLLNAASDYLPRFASKPPTISLAQGVLPATIRLILRKSPFEAWFRLHLGVELLTIIIFVWLGVNFGFSGEFLLLGAGYTLFVLIAIIDWKYRLILNIITYPAMVVALSIQLFVLHHDPRTILVGAVLPFAVFWLAAWLRPGQLGGGDVKLALLIGLTFGFPQVLWALLVGAGAGGIAAVILLSRRAGLKYRIPYAPFLCVGAIVILMYYSLHLTL